MLGEIEGDLDEDREGERDGLKDGERLEDGLVDWDILGLVDGLIEDDIEGLKLGEIDADILGEREGLVDGEADGEKEATGAKYQEAKTHAGSVEPPLSIAMVRPLCASTNSLLAPVQSKELSLTRS